MLWLLAGVLASAGYVGHSRLGHPAIESTPGIAPSSSAHWLSVAEEANREGAFIRASAAFKKVLELEPYCHEALLGYPLCLARCDQTDELTEAVKALALSHAKLAVTLLESPELAPYLATPHFQQIAREARSQAVD